MIIGDYARCQTTDCGTEYRIRLHLGNSFPQVGTFKCKKCGENLKYGRDKDRITVFEGLEIIDDSPSPIIQNIHPELPINSTKENDSQYFPSLEFLSQINLTDVKEYSLFRDVQKKMVGFKDRLEDIQPKFKYLKEKRWTFLEEKYGKNQVVVEKRILKEAMEVGRLFINGKWWEDYRNGLVEVEKAKNHPNFNALKQYFADRKEELLIEKFYSIIELYKKNYQELLPTLISQKISIPVAGNSSVADWEKIEFLYGSLYEILGDLMVIPTTINNLLLRGDYDKFQSPGFAFQTYLSSDKARRGDNFSANPLLNWIDSFYNPGIRNATNHKNSKAERDDQEIVLRTGKGGNTVNTISLIEYVEHCNELYARCMIIYMYLYKILY